MEPSRQKRYYYKQSRFQQLRGFYHVVVANSFTAAAESMALEQPTVTLQVQALEREMKTTLFEKKRGGLVLTHEGELLFELAAPAIETLESLEAAFEERLGRAQAGKVVCAGPEAMVQHLLPAVVRGFVSQFPNVDVVLRSSASYGALDLLMRGEVEVSISAPMEVPRNVFFHPLVSYDNYLVVRQDHPLADRQTAELTDLASYPLIATVEEGTLWQRLHQALVKSDVDCKIAIRLDSSEARLRCVESGLGVTIAVGMPQIPRTTPRLRWIPLTGQLPATTFGLMTRRNSYLSWAARRFVDFVLEAAPRFGPPPGLHGTNQDRRPEV